MSKSKGKILIVDDNEGILKSLSFTLNHDFEEVVAIKNPNQLPALVQSKSFDVILLDMNFSAGLNTGNEGLFWMKEILKYDPDAIIILITAYGDIELAVKAIKDGATDFVQKPWITEKLISNLQSAYQLRQSKLKVNQLTQRNKHFTQELDKNFVSFIWQSEEMKNIYETIKKVSKTEANVLILGENGTGKELVAREIHRQSKRANEVFISVDLGSISENLFESELFGYLKGAFTDAKEDRKGRLEIASGGSLFLDEVSNLSFSLQSKLLTVLQNRSIIPVGGNLAIPVNIRLISASNKSINQLIKEKLFREDLFYRINTIQIVIPPLRNRGEDIVLLAEHFLHVYAKKYEKPLLKISSEVAGKLLQYRWPGNVRELMHAIEKAVILCDSDKLKPTDFNFYETKEIMEKESLRTLNLEGLEKSAIKEAIIKHKGNITRAADELGITRKTLYYKIEKYDL